ncbi:MAG: hypothetical protein M1839_001668 [Geoglossum umbratile]|nr:MAG: hypothetical protein M1839_001668 [Geoglossum umbratile]
MPPFWSKAIAKLNPRERQAALKSSSAASSVSNLARPGTPLPSPPEVFGPPVVSSTLNLETGLETELGDAPAVCDPPAPSVVSAGSNLAPEQGAELGTPVDRIPQEKAKSSKSLWDRAYDGLRTEKRELVEAFEKILMSELDLTISLGGGDVSRREKQMSALVNKKLEAMNEKQWRVKACGRSVEIRQKVDRIVKVVLVGKDFISAAASIDPIHAGLPWAGVCMLLTLVVNDSKQRAVAIDGLEYVSDLVRRYAEIEHIYLQGEGRGELEAAVTKLYCQVLEFEARAACQFNRNTLLQTARNIVEADGWEDILGSIKGSAAACDELARIIDAKDQWAGMARLESALDEQNSRVAELLSVSREQDKELLDEIKDMRKDQRDLVETKEETDCLKSLRTTVYEETMQSNPDRVPGTCEWFLRHPKYCEWLYEPSSSLLWATADPGCGKSVLSKFLIEDYRSWMWTDTSICYFFFKDDSDENRSATNALCAILHQLFRQNHSLLKHAVAEYKSNGDKLPQLFGSLWSILMKAAADSNSGSIVCILDALDECAKSSCEKLIKYLVEFHSTVSRTARIKFLITSRPSAFIRRTLSQHLLGQNQNLASLQLAGENESEMEEIGVEINLVVDAKVKELRELRLSCGIDDNAHVVVQEQLKKIGNRTYLWMSLIFPELVKMAENAEDELLEEVKRIPHTVYEAYERILAKSSNHGKARRLLHIICAASRPLTLAEMNRALSINDNGFKGSFEPRQSFPRIVRDLCGLFVNIQHGRIYLIHQTAREFLIRENATGESVVPLGSGKGSWKHSLEPIESNLVLAKICISYLLSPVFENDPLVIHGGSSEEQVGRYTTKHDFLDYSAKHWAAHFQEAEIMDMAVFESTLEVCNTQSKRFLTWFQVYWIAVCSYFQCPQNFTNLMVGSYFGHIEVVRLLVENGAEVNAGDEGGRTALHWAVRNGREAVVKLLVEKGAEVNAKDRDGRAALHWAVWNGHEAVVKLLIEEGAEVNAKDIYGWMALHAAVWNGHKVVVKLLVEGGAEANAKDKDGLTALDQAAKNGHEAVVKLLVEGGAEVGTKGKGGSTALHEAAWNGHEAVVKLLVEEGAEVNPKGKGGLMVLHRTAWNGYEAVVKLLVEKGAEVNAKDTDGWTALHKAAWNGREAVVKLLVEKGAEINAKDKDGSTALHKAAKNGHEAVVKLLVEKGVEVNAKDEYGWMALDQAASDGHEAVVKLLVEKGAEVNAKDKYGSTALYKAVVRKHEAVAKLLVEKGAEINAKYKGGSMALHQTALNGQEAVVKLLVEKGAEVNAKDTDGSTALHNAAENGHEAVVKLLVEKGAEVDAKDEDGLTALHKAAWKGHKAVVELLVEKGVEVNAKDKEGWTALHRAASGGREATGDWHKAASGGYKAVVELLIEKGAEVNGKDEIDGLTALHLAASSGHNAVVKPPVEKGAEVNAKDEDRLTALHLAARNGHEAVTGFEALQVD